MRQRAFLNDEGLDAVEVELEKENDACYSIGASFGSEGGGSYFHISSIWEPLDSEEMKAAIGKIRLVRDHLDALIAEYKLACIKEGIPREEP